MIDYSLREMHLLTGNTGNVLGLSSPSRKRAGPFGPFDPMPNQKTMQTSCLGGFRYVGTKTFTYLIKIRIFGPKMAIFMLSLAHVGLAGLFGALLY